MGDFRTSTTDCIVALSDLVFPRRCLVCGRVLDLRERHICVFCRSEFPYTWYWSYKHNPMADKYNALICRDLASEDNAGVLYQYAAALFFYRSGEGYGNVTRQLKYHAAFAEGRAFSRQLGLRLAASPMFSDVTLVVPVPLYRTRRWQRGYNQAEVIAREVAACLGVSCLPHFLVRRRRTGTQTRLTAEERAANVAGAFTLSRRAFRYCSHLSDGAHILLIDDVFTTGATIHACFAALRPHLPSGIRISCATLGFVR